MEVKGLSNKIIWISTVFLLSAVTIFESYSWGKYILILICAIIILVDTWTHKGKYRYKISGYQFFIAGLSIYSLLSSTWGINSQDCIVKAYTYLQILICMSVVYNHFIQFEDVKQLLSIVKWSSYIISIYSILYYGYGFVMQMIVAGVRLDNTYSNVNTIGMLAAIGIIIQLDEIKRKHKFLLSTFFCIPSFIMVLATQSRKALIMLILGTVAVLIFRSVQKGKILFSILKIFIVGIVAIVLIKYILSFSAFAGINHRMESMFAMFTGKGKIDHSTLLRQQLIDLGLQIFKSNPIIGIGMGCPHIVAGQRLHFDAYLHNNFFEILAAGGMMGFLFYYGCSYVYLIYKFVKLNKYRDETYVICAILLGILLFRDYAMVSLYSKEMYFYFMILFLTVKKMDERKKYRKIKNDENKQNI